MKLECACCPRDSPGITLTLPTSALCSCVGQHFSLGFVWVSPKTDAIKQWPLCLLCGEQSGLPTLSPGLFPSARW